MTIDLNPTDVEEFLRAHPNFLQDRPGLLAVLNLPHGGEGAVSLVERQVSVLRQRNIVSRQQINSLSDIGRENDRLLEATRRTVLALLAGTNRQELAQIWLVQVTNTFKAIRSVFILNNGRHRHILCQLLGTADRPRTRPPTAMRC